MGAEGPVGGSGRGRAQAAAKPAERQLVSSRSARQSASATRASGTHLPQQVPSPVWRLSSLTQLTPPLTAERMCRSETALQTQTIMGPI